jgi:RHS repeat-associated protein
MIMFGGWASCNGGTSDTLTKFFVYGSSTSTVANNLGLTVVTVEDAVPTIIAPTTTTYDIFGNAKTVTDPTSMATAYQYDGFSRLVGTVNANPGTSGAKNAATRVTYNADDQITVVEQGLVNSQLDSDWSTFTTTPSGGPTGTVQTTTYDSAHRPIQVSVAAGGTTYNVSQQSYDAAGRLDCVAVRLNPTVFGSLPSSACTLGTAGSAGNDRITKYTYDRGNASTDSADKVAVRTLGYGTGLQEPSETYVYNANGTVKTVADANNNLTTYTYDGWDRLSTTAYPNPGTAGVSSTIDIETYGYDAAGNITSWQKRDRTTNLTRAYDHLNRLVTAEDGTTYTYDNLSNVLTTSRSGVTDTRTYDAIERLSTVITPLSGTSFTVGYSYDLAGRRTQLSYPGSFAATYDYDSAGRLVDIKQIGTAVVTFGLDDLGRRTSLTRANGVTTTYAFAGPHQLTGLVHDFPGTTYDETVTLAYNAASQISSRSGVNAAFQWTPSGTTTTYAKNGLNQMTSAGGASQTYYAATSPATAVPAVGAQLTSGANTYTYDNVNRLSGMSGVTMTYDPDSRLSKTTASSATTQFLYDGNDIIAEYDGAGPPSLLRRYVHGPATDEPLVWYEGATTAYPRWFSADERGSVIMVTDITGGASTSNAYDAFGTPAGYAGRFGYTGQAWIPEMGLYDYKARFYSPTLGRFLQPDPIRYGDGLNFYAYVHNDPINGLDPTGTDCIEDTSCTVSGVDVCGGPSCVFGPLGSDVYESLGNGNYYTFGEHYPGGRPGPPPSAGRCEGLVRTSEALDKFAKWTSTAGDFALAAGGVALVLQPEGPGEAGFVAGAAVDGGLKGLATIISVTSSVAYGVGTGKWDKLASNAISSAFSAFGPVSGINVGKAAKAAGDSAFSHAMDSIPDRSHPCG